MFQCIAVRRGDESIPSSQLNSKIPQLILHGLHRFVASISVAKNNAYEKLIHVLRYSEVECFLKE
jgi:hypothetical protein